MLEQRYGRWLPRFLLRRFMTVETKIDEAVERFAEQLPPNARVLDAGAGEGRYRRFFRRQRYCGVDLAVGDRLWDYSGLDALGDLTRLPVGDATFDAALNIVVLEHTQEPALALREIGRALRPGGALLLAAPQQWEIHQAPHDYFRFTRYGLTYLLEQAGFQDIRVQPLGGYFALLGRRCINSLNFFQQGLRWGLFPFVALAAGALALALPALDSLDREKNFTLAYLCTARKR